MGYYTSIWGSGVIFMVTKPNVRFRAGYYSPLWDPEAIYLADVPQGALTCMTLTHTVLADSGLFWPIITHVNDE